MKLNLLKAKNARYQSHREFLLQYIESKLMPKVLKLELEPTIGNHKTISRNEEATKRVLKQRKFKKFNYLKHKPDTERNQKTSQTTTIQDNLKPTYASIFKYNTNVASNSINQNTNPTGERPTLQQKLRSFTSKQFKKQIQITNKESIKNKSTKSIQ